MQALQSGLITPAQYEMMMQKIQQMEMNGVMTRGMDTPQERDMLQGLLGGGQQVGPASVEPEWQPPKYEEPIRPNVINAIMGQQMGSVPMPQAPEPTMPMMPMPNADPSQMQMSPMPQMGAPTQNETDFLGQFVDNAKKAMYR